MDRAFRHDHGGRTAEPPQRQAAEPLRRSDRAATALRKGIDHLLSLQRPDGHWCAELEGDTILESEFLLTMQFLGRIGEERCRKAGEYLRRKQLEGGGWPLYPEGPAEVSASVKAYFVLKLLGDAPDAPHMALARRKILELGGVEACNTFTKIYLAVFGQFPWKDCPAVPPEMMLLPLWFPVNIYEMSSWSRTIVVPLSILWAHRPVQPVPDDARIDELYSGKRPSKVGVERFLSRKRGWTVFFKVVDAYLKLRERVPFKPLRKKSLKRAEAWVLARLERSDGLGAIFPPIVNTILALRCLGYEPDHPVLAAQVRELEKLSIEEEETLRLQPCFSPVWDTGLALTSLLYAGLAQDHPAAQNAARWLLDKEVRHGGDWQVKVKGVGPGGWYFEYANEFYPDCDDTAEILVGLSKVRMPHSAEEERRKVVVRRALDWLLAMQNDDGGWAAFDRGCTHDFLRHVPFADHNAMLDPSCEDITGRTLECLEALGRVDEPAARSAVTFLRRMQGEDGSWYGRWGCNFIYGTWLAITGLTRAGVGPEDETVSRGVRWIEEHQNEDGGWGETQASYDFPERKGRGVSTAAQTSWALLALLAGGRGDSEAVRKGVEFLVERQRTDGSWYDEPWTATGFPRVFYLRYHYYCLYFPLRALAAYGRETVRGNRV